MQLRGRFKILPLSPGSGNGELGLPATSPAPRPSNLMWFGPQLGRSQRLCARGVTTAHGPNHSVRRLPGSLLDRGRRLYDWSEAILEVGNTKQF